MRCKLSALHSTRIVEVKIRKTNFLLNKDLNPCAHIVCVHTWTYILVNVPEMCSTYRCWRKTQVTEGCCKLDPHLDNTWLPWDAQGNNPGLYSMTVLSASTVTFEFQLISHTVFLCPLLWVTQTYREFVHLLVLDQGLNCAHGINNLVCLPTVFFVGFFGQDSGGLWRAHLSQGWFWQCWTRGAVLIVETMNPWPKLVFQEDSFRVCSQMEQMFTSSFHVNFWHFALVILTTKSGNGEVYGKEKLNLLNFFHILLSSFEAVGLPKLLPFSCLFSSVSTLPSVESSLLESFPPLLSWLTRVMMTSWNIFFSIWDKWDSMYWQGQVRREKWSLSLMY